VVSWSVRIVPLPPSEKLRPLAMLAVVLSVPPSRPTPPAASPRLASVETTSVPPLIAVPPA
jgi:antitoxin (DNA-binding transcriptional repressor) of toxin-antitoxin stability system